MNRHHVRLAMPDDEQSIVALFNEVFPQTVTKEAWRWKTVSNPAGPALSGVACRGGEIAGHLCFNRSVFTIGSKRWSGAQAVDMVTSPRYRGTLAGGRVMLGISRFLSDELHKRRYASFIYGFAMPHLLSFSQEVIGGGDVVCRIPQFVKLCNPAYLLRGVLVGHPRLLNPLRHAGRTCGKTLSNITEGRRTSRIRQVTTFDERFNGLWDAVRSGFDISTVRDRRYLEWRYPPSRYAVFCDDDASTVHGFVVLRITTWNGWRIGCIADVLSDGIPSARLLIQQAVSYLRSKSVDVIRCWMMEHAPYAQLFRRMGFATRPSPYTLVVRSHSRTLDQQYLQDASNWFITWGDSDGV